MPILNFRSNSVRNVWGFVAFIVAWFFYQAFKDEYKQMKVSKLIKEKNKHVEEVDKSEEETADLPSANENINEKNCKI